MTPLDQLDISTLRVIDGGMATELERLGCDIRGNLWSAHALYDSPDSIEAVHRSYLEAGADCILTASYQISFEGYAELGHSPDAAANALRQSVALAEAARAQFQTEHPGNRIFIAASLGPYGAALHNGAEYHGNYDCSFDDLVRFHERRLAVLAPTNADFVALETIPSLEEASAIVEALRNYPEIGAWITFTCSDDEHVAHGERIVDCAFLLDPERQIVAIGVNCTAPSFVSGLIRELKSVTAKPVIVYPNSGEGWDAENRRWLANSAPADFATLAREWRSLGAQAVGGCCRTGPEHIRQIASSLRV